MTLRCLSGQSIPTNSRTGALSFTKEPMKNTPMKGANVVKRTSSELLRCAPSLCVAALVLAASGVFQDSACAKTPVAQSFLEEHCYDCHNAELKKGGLNLAALAFQPEDAHNFASWVKVFDRVSAGEMPPKKRARPEAADLEGFLREVASALRAADEKRIASEGRATQRRLNNCEYENALRDLLSAPWLQVKGQFPDDGEAFRFNKVGDALDVSHVQMARYLSAADYALRQVLSVQLEQQPTTTKRYYARDQRTLTSKFTGNVFNTSPDRMTYPVVGLNTPQPDVRWLRAPLTDPKTRDEEAVAWVSSNYVTGFTYRWDQFRAPSRVAIGFDSAVTRSGCRQAAFRCPSKARRTRSASRARPARITATTIGRSPAAPMSPSRSTPATAP